jgi:hypothetical protein
MRLNSLSRLLLMSVATTAVASPAFATFHLMQIQQVIGGVNGDMTLQAIQLRMRAGSQGLVSSGRLRAWDANGANPILISDPTTNVTSGAGLTVLIASPNFQGAFGLAPDFVMSNLIPASYLAAGKLTWEDNSGAIVFWGLAWGGAAYTGTNTGDTSNDTDGNFNPPATIAMPSATGQALAFTGAFGAMSTNNAADYAITAGDAIFTRNDGQSTTVPVELQKLKIE